MKFVYIACVTVLAYGDVLAYSSSLDFFQAVNFHLAVVALQNETPENKEATRYFQT